MWRGEVEGRQGRREHGGALRRLLFKNVSGEQLGRALFRICLLQRAKAGRKDFAFGQATDINLNDGENCYSIFIHKRLW